MAVTLRLFEDWMTDPHREQRRQIRDEIAGRRSPTGGHPAPEPKSRQSQQPVRQPAVSGPVRPNAKPDENPFPDYIPLPPDFKEAPLA